MDGALGASGKHTREETEQAMLSGARVIALMSARRDALLRASFNGWSLVVSLRRRAKSKGHMVVMLHELSVLGGLPSLDIAELWLQVGNVERGRRTHAQSRVLLVVVVPST
eukprot:6207894-Pleurochrysis_carterae.AAC.1